MVVEALNFYVNASYKLLSKSTKSAEEPQKRVNFKLIVIVVTLLSYGCPVQAIVHAFGLDERTVADWRDRAGVHCQHVHEHLVEQGHLDLLHIQADAHSGERMQDGGLDGIGHDDFDAFVACRSRPALA